MAGQFNQEHFAQPLRVGVLLAGCGVFDGSEIHESTLTLLALDKRGAKAVCLAPDHNQAMVFNHCNRQSEIAERNALQEAARITRGEICELQGTEAAKLDALIIPGGHGVGRNLCSYLVDGPVCTVRPEVARLIGDMLAAGKPIGAICLAPVLVARVAKDAGLKPRLTIGHNSKVAADLIEMGTEHVICDETDIIIDPALKIVSTPAYMCASRISLLAGGIDALVAEVIGMAHAH